MQNQFVITIDSKVSPDYALSFLKNINFIKSVKPQKTMDKGQSLAERFRAKIPKEVGLEMHKQLDKLRDEWERDI